MKRFGWMTAVVMGLALSTAACGGGAGGDAKSGEEADADPVQKLEAEMKAITDDVDAIFKPLDDLEAALGKLGNLEAEFGVKIDSKALATVGKGLLEGKLDLAPLKLEGEAAAKLEGFFKSIGDAITSMKDIPEKAGNLVTNLPGRIPGLLAASVEANATVKLKSANPFASDEDKAKITADLAKLENLAIEKTVNDLIEKVKGAPGRATESLAKVTKAFGG
jgi:hypothetical protein